MKLACLSGWKWHLEKYRLDLVKAPVSQMFLTVFCISVSFFIRWKIIQTNSRSFGERPSQNSYLCTLVILGDPWWSLVQWEAHGRKLCRCVAEGFVQWSGTRTWSGALGFAFSQDQHSGKQKNDPLKIEYIVLVHMFFLSTCIHACGHAVIVYCIIYIVYLCKDTIYAYCESVFLDQRLMLVWAASGTQPDPPRPGADTEGSFPCSL